MLNFNYKNIDEMIKKAEVNVLLKSIHIGNPGLEVYPINCPGNNDNILKDSNNNSVCALNGNSCPYFIECTFNLEGYIKEIICSVESTTTT